MDISTAAVMSDTLKLAYVIMGEAGVCGVAGMLAAAYVCNRNDQCYGWRTPNQTALWIASAYLSMPDPTTGAYHLFSKSDTFLPAVRRLTKNRSPVAKFMCGKNNYLVAY
jgi:hypothetical protein